MAGEEGGVFISRTDSLSSTPASVSTEQLDLDLEELDDTEYEIPPVDNPPTLESILNEPDEVEGESGSDEELSSSAGLFHESADTVSVASISSIDSKGLLSEIRRQRRGPQSHHSHIGILRHVILKGVSVQVVSASERVNAGMPTAMAVSVLIGVGTAHGLILIFDGRQVLKWCLGTAATGAQYGSVSALSFNNDNTRLLCGYAKGAITMWDLITGKLLRTITDAHPPGSAVLHVKFTDDPTLAVCSDSGGSVFELNFRRTMGVRSCESRCLFSGSRGEVCTIQPLLSSSSKDHPLQDMCLLAMATMSKVIVVSIRPKLKVLFTHALQAKPNTLPLIAWQYVIIQVSPSFRLLDPVFSFGRDDVLYFFQVSMKEKRHIVFIPLKKIELSYTMLNFCWLNTRTMVVLDTSEQLRMIDVRTQEVLEITDLANVQLVYGSSHFKGLATGGNVSKAMAFAGDQACYQSLMNFNGQILLLGMKSVHLITIRTWKERLDHLANQHKFLEALELAQAFFEDKAKAVVGLSGKKEEKMVAVAKEMWNLLHAYMSYALTKSCFESARPETLEEYYSEVIPTCIENHLVLEEKFVHYERKGFVRPSSLPNFIENLFGEMYDSFRSQSIARVVFLESLEQHILNGRFENVPIPPAVASDFVDHYASKEKFEDLQACIIRMDISTLDMHQVMKLCWANGLYDAIVHIHNKAMNDFIGPLEEFFALLQDSLSTGKQLNDNQITLGNTILVYISCCLAGRAYPIGNIAPADVYSVKEKVFRCLTTRHSANRKPNEPLYPYLRILLHFDTREFLNVLSLAFEETEFEANVGLWCRQDVVDILLEVMHRSQEFSPTEVGALFTFLARQMAKHETTIIVNRSLFEQVVEYLTNTSEESRHEERQQALLELHASGGLRYYDEDRLLIQAEKAEFFRVCELLYTKRREFNRLLNCYLQDPARKLQSFSFVRNLLSNQDITAKENDDIQEEVIKHIEELLDIDNTKTAQLLSDCFPNVMAEVMTKLENNSSVQYQFLNGIFEYQQVLELNSKTFHKDEPTDSQLVEKFIDLMCQFNPTNVYKFIHRRDDYRLEETLDIIQKYGVSDAAAFLLEKLGRLSEAFNILIQNLEFLIGNLLTQVTSGDYFAPPSANFEWSLIQGTLLMLIQFCQRNSSRMSENEREMLWFQLLDAIMVPQRKVTSDSTKEYFEAFKESTNHLLNSMMGHIKLPSLLQKIIIDPSYNISKFSEIRDLLLGMLETYNYEKTLLQTTQNLLNFDLHCQLRQLCVTANRGYVAQNNGCNVCNQTYDTKALDGNTDSIILFRCGHSYHVFCLQAVEPLNANSQLQGEWTCHLCQSYKKREPMLNRRISVREVKSASSPGVTNRCAELLAAAAPKTKINLDQQQILAMERLRKIHRTGSRAAMLAQLSKQNTKSGNPRHKESSILQNENFALRLAPPRPQNYK